MIRDLIMQNRSYRRFDQSYVLDQAVLRELVDLARLGASGANLQPLKYVLVNEPARNAAVFEHLAWAGYLPDWPGPTEGQRPSAYIVILNDTRIARAPGCDHGIAAQNILLGATERGLGGCMIGSIERASLARVLDLPDHLQVVLVVALGKPAEQVVLEDVAPGGSIKYYRDENDIHHVPKRKLDDIIVQV